QGDLTEEQIEKIGTTLMVLEERMTELREHFELSPEDLNIDLVPSGRCCPINDPCTLRASAGPPASLACGHSFKDRSADRCLRLQLAEVFVTQLLERSASTV